MQRLQLGTALATCYALELLMRPLHVGFKRYYSLQTLLYRSRKRTAVILLRLLLCVAMAATCEVPLSPVNFVWVQAAFAVASTMLAHLQHFRLSLADIEEYVSYKRSSHLAAPKHQSKFKTSGLG